MTVLSRDQSAQNGSTQL